MNDEYKHITMVNHHLKTTKNRATEHIERERYFIQDETKYYISESF